MLFQDGPILRNQWRDLVHNGGIALNANPPDLWCRLRAPDISSRWSRSLPVGIHRPVAFPDNLLTGLAGECWEHMLRRVFIAGVFGLERHPIRHHEEWRGVLLPERQVSEKRSVG